MIYYISDLHLGHANVLKFDQRPFSSIEEMDKTIIDNWNKTVNDNDTIYILGDISWYNDEKTAELISQLKGHKRLIKGNHDRVHGKVKDCFEVIKDYDEIKDNGRDVILCHYPIMFYNKHYYDAYHLYGHVHNSKEYYIFDSFIRQLNNLSEPIPTKTYNVGCMMNYMNYTPRTLDEIIKTN